MFNVSLTPKALSLVLLFAAVSTLSSKPAGTLRQFEFRGSQIYPGTVRDYWVYTPVGYEESDDPCLMVFNDGHDYVRESGHWRAPEVIDELLAAGEIPMCVAVFAKWGRIDPENEDQIMRMNRSFEYDSVGDRFVTFLEEELLPEVRKSYRFSNDGNDRAIIGSSTGGICAFNVVWERPDRFSRVFCTVGTFVGFRGGHELEFLIRKSEPKPIRVVLYDGRNDLDNQVGNWWHSNQLIYTALKFHDYEVEVFWDDGEHGGKFCGKWLPDGLREIWRGWPESPKPGTLNEKNRAHEILLPGEGWKQVAETPEGLCYLSTLQSGAIVGATKEGRIFKFDGAFEWELLADMGMPIFCIDGIEDNRLSVLREDALLFVAGENGETVGEIILDLSMHDILPFKNGVFFAVDTPGSLYRLDSSGARERLELEFPSGSHLARDPSDRFLAALSNDSRFGWSGILSEDQGVHHAQRFYHIHVPEYSDKSGLSEILFERKNGLLLAPTSLGIQVFGHQGRCDGIIDLPENSVVRAITFGLGNESNLYALTENGLFKRRTQTGGVHVWSEHSKVEKFFR